MARREMKYELEEKSTTKVCKTLKTCSPNIMRVLVGTKRVNMMQTTNWRIGSKRLRFTTFINLTLYNVSAHTKAHISMTNEMIKQMEYAL